MILSLFDQETIIKNHDASVARKTRKETTDLMAFLAKNGRTDDIVKASIDEGFLEKLLAEFQGMALAK